MTYQAWQTQWNQAMEDLVRANTMAMLARSAGLHSAMQR
jgi:uncharacterized protein YukE